MMKINYLKKKCVFLSDFGGCVVVLMVLSFNNSPYFIEMIINENIMKISTLKKKRVFLSDFGGCVMV